MKNTRKLFTLKVSTYAFMQTCTLILFDIIGRVFFTDSNVNFFEDVFVVAKGYDFIKNIKSFWIPLFILTLTVGFFVLIKLKRSQQISLKNLIFISILTPTFVFAFAFLGFFDYGERYINFTLSVVLSIAFYDFIKCIYMCKLSKKSNINLQ